MAGDGSALPIDGEAMISPGTKSVRHADWMLSVLDYGNVRNVSHFGKHRDGARLGDVPFAILDSLPGGA